MCTSIIPVRPLDHWWLLVGMVAVVDPFSQEKSIFMGSCTVFFIIPKSAVCFLVDVQSGCINDELTSARFHFELMDVKNVRAGGGHPRHFSGEKFSHMIEVWRLAGFLLNPSRNLSIICVIFCCCASIHGLINLSLKDFPKWSCWYLPLFFTKTKNRDNEQLNVQTLLWSRN